MAFIIRANLAYGPQVKFFDDDVKPLKDFFAQTDAYPGTIIGASWVSGTPFPADVMPRRVRHFGKVMRDWMTLYGGGTLVSSRTKVAIEELDPGRHQFFQVIVEDKNGNDRPGDFFVFNVLGRIEAIIEDRSNLKASGRGDVENWGYTRRVGPWQVVLDAAIIGGRACWIEHRFSQCWFISDRLAALMKKRKFTGYNVDHHCEEVSL